MSKRFLGFVVYRFADCFVGLVSLGNSYRRLLMQARVLWYAVHAFRVCGIKHERLLLAICLFSASRRIVLEGQVAGSALPQTKILMQLARVCSEN